MKAIERDANEKSCKEEYEFGPAYFLLKICPQNKERRQLL